MPRNALELEYHDGAPAVPQAGPVSKDAEPRASLDARRDNTEGGQPAEQPPRGSLQTGHQRFVLTDSVAFRQEDSSRGCLLVLTCADTSRRILLP